MKKISLLAVLMCITAGLTALAQENSKKYEFDVTTDIVSTYVWRGMIADPSPNFQPSMIFTWKNLTLGAWGSTNFTGTYKEVDLYVTYTLGRFSLTLNDYCWDPNISQTPYFEYSNDKTGHIGEGSFVYTGGDKFPLKVTLATLFYGADKKLDGNEWVNQYSTYFELCYPFSLGGRDVEVCAGGTPAEGFYGNTAGITNLMLTTKREIKITDHFTLPLKGGLVFNPQSSDAFFVLTLTL